MKFPKYKILTKICPAGTEFNLCGRTEGRTDQRTDLTKIILFIKIFFEQALSSSERDRARSVEPINLS